MNDCNDRAAPRNERQRQQRRQRQDGGEGVWQEQGDKDGLLPESESVAIMDGGSNKSNRNSMSEQQQQHHHAVRLGYQSSQGGGGSSALSNDDGREGGHGDGGNDGNNTMRSSGSVCSQGSGGSSSATAGAGSASGLDRHAQHYPSSSSLLLSQTQSTAYFRLGNALLPPTRDLLPPPIHNIMNGETRFPTAFSYATSETAKSDIATVCSGSITEDIEVASVLSAEYGYNNAPPQIPNNLAPSTNTPTSSCSGGGGQQQPNHARRTASGGRVEFAAVLPIHASSSTYSTGSFSGHHHSQEAVHDMGPPLSRALLLQRHHPPGTVMAPGGLGGATSSCASNCSRAGSVRSFGSTAGGASDVVAHVDTDDCGDDTGSFTDGHSIQSSQEGSATGLGGSNATIMGLTMNGGDAHHHQGDHVGAEANNIEGRSSVESETHATLHKQGDAAIMNDPNGRVSPGGTVYKGRGVRRYQGRYMNLPLKRFHQNRISLCDNVSTSDDHASNGFVQNGFSDTYEARLYDDRDRHESFNNHPRERSVSPAHRRWNSKDRRPSPSAPDRLYNGNRNHRRRRSRSRSPPTKSVGSRAPPRSRIRDRRSSRSSSRRSGSKSPSGRNNKKAQHKSRGGDRYYSSSRDRNNRHSESPSRSSRNPRSERSPSRCKRRHRNGK